MLIKDGIYTLANPRQKIATTGTLGFDTQRHKFIEKVSFSPSNIQLL